MSMVSRTTSLPRHSQPVVPQPGVAQPGAGSLPHNPLTSRGTAQEPISASGSPSPRVELTLLSREQRSERSDRFDAGGPGSSSHFSPRFDLAPTADHVAIDMPPAAQTPHEQVIGSRLADMEFSSPSPAQQALEREYIAWAAGVLQARERTFGGGRYSVDQDRKVSIGEALLPAAYDGVRQFLSSSARSPVASSVATAIAERFNGTDSTGRRVNQGELSNNYDPALIGGMLGGTTALAVDSTLLSAMDRRARLANLPQLAPVDVKALVPDPAPVQLSVVQGTSPDGQPCLLKEYWKPLAANDDLAGKPDRPTMATLQQEAEQHRQQLATLQSMLQAQSWGLLAQPLVTGAANVLRRYLMPAKALLKAGPVMGSSVLASGTAGGITKFGLGLLKAPAHANVDNLVGGKQRVNIFQTRLPQPDVRAATWSDIGSLPRHAADVLRETGSLAKHYLAGPWRSSNGPVPSGAAVLARVGDVAHAVVANTFAAVFSTGTGPLMAQIMRRGAAAALPGESQQSGAYLLQQFAQSATNDFVWQASRAAFKSSAFDLAKSLDRWRDNQQVELLQTARRAQGELPELARELANNPASHGDRALQSALEALQELQRDDEVQTRTLRGALSELKRHAQEPGSNASVDVGPLTQRIETALQSMEQREAIIRWRAPAGQH